MSSDRLAKLVIPSGGKAAMVLARRLDRRRLHKPEALSFYWQTYPEFMDRAETWKTDGVADDLTEDGGMMKQCYYNALEQKKNNPDRVLYFGLGIQDELPIAYDHAWCVDGDRVIDTTWTKAATYVGVPVVNVEAYERLIKGGTMGVTYIMSMSQAKERMETFGF